MNVDKHVQVMTEEEGRKRFPKGYFADIERTQKGGGIVMLVMGAEAPMKYGDIKGAYQVSRSEQIYTGKAMKTIQRMYLAVFARNWTFGCTYAKPEVAKRVQEMLLERNPDIDVADGRVLSDQEYDEMVKEYQERRRG